MKMSSSSISEEVENSSSDGDDLSSLSSFTSVSSGDSLTTSENDSDGDDTAPEDTDDLVMEGNDHVGEFLKDPLYEGSRLSVFECCTLVMLFRSSTN